MTGCATASRPASPTAIRRWGKGAKVNVEYVSANPTGPLHVAHARGAVVGDALANLLAKAGYAVTKEYYINDAGAQVDKLGQSTFLRYKEALGDAIGDIPEGLYPGEYLKDVGAAIAKRDGARWIDKPQSDWLPVDARLRHRHADGRDQDRSRHARRPHGRLFVRTRAWSIPAPSIAPSRS